MLILIPLTEEGTQYDSTGVVTVGGVNVPVVLPVVVAIQFTPSARQGKPALVVVGQLATQTPFVQTPFAQLMI